MKKKSVYIFLIVSITFLFSCNKSSRKNSTDVHKDPLYQEKFIAQIQTYYSFAKTCKSEYQLDSFLNKLSLVREAKVKQMNGEENWSNFLEWLKKNGATVPGTTEDGVPSLSERQKSPYEVTVVNK